MKDVMLVILLEICIHSFDFSCRIWILFGVYDVSSGPWVLHNGCKLWKKWFRLLKRLVNFVFADIACLKPFVILGLEHIRNRSQDTASSLLELLLLFEFLDNGILTTTCIYSCLIYIRETGSLRMVMVWYYQWLILPRLDDWRILILTLGPWRVVGWAQVYWILCFNFARWS